MDKDISNEKDTKNNTKPMLEVSKYYSSLLFQLMIITFIFFCVYLIFCTQVITSLIGFSLLSNYIGIISVITCVSIIIAIHLVRIKLVLYRIFLQTFLSTKSKVYIFFSHGFFVRLIGILLAIGCAIKILIFLCLANLHISQFIALYIGFIVFWLFRYKIFYGKSLGFIREDVGRILKSYLIPFLIATALGACISIWEIYNLDKIPAISNLSEALEITINSIDPNRDMYWHPVRVLLRHVYAYELLVQQLLQLKPLGQVLFFIYLVVSEGAITFFGIFLLGMPLKDETENEKV